MTQFEEDGIRLQDEWAMKSIQHTRYLERRRAKERRLAAHHAWTIHWRTRFAGWLAHQFNKILRKVALPEPQLEEGDCPAYTAASRRTHGSDLQT